MDSCFILNVILIVLMVNICGILSLKSEDCEVCISYLSRFQETLTEKQRSNTDAIENTFRQFCKVSKGKDNRFCYYLGGLEDSATGILNEMSKPMSWSMPVEKICEKLKKKDSQICGLRYDKQIDLKNVDFKKLKVRELKKILSDWDENCEECIEKSDFIHYIEKIKPKYMKIEL